MEKAPTSKQPRYDAAFRAKALRLASESRATLTVFDHHKRRYGTRRLPVELREKGCCVGRQALHTGLHRHGQKAL